MLNAFFRWLLRRPDRSRACKLVTEGVDRYHRGDLQGALEAYQRAAVADPTYALAPLNIALAREDLLKLGADHDAEARQGELQDILRALDQALQLDPSLAPAYLNRGHVLRLLGREEEAIDDLQRYLELGPKDDADGAEAQQQIDDLLRRAAQRRQRDAAIELVARTDSRASEIQRSLEILVELARQDGEDSRCWHMIAVGRLRLQDPEGAREALDRCLQIDPADAAAYHLRSTLARDADQVEEALDNALAAYRLEPTNAGFVCNVGACYLHLGQTDQAREHFELARALAPDDPIVARCLGALQTAATGEEDA